MRLVQVQFLHFLRELCKQLVRLGKLRAQVRVFALEIRDALRCFREEQVPFIERGPPPLHTRMVAPRWRLRSRRFFAPLTTPRLFSP